MQHSDVNQLESSMEESRIISWILNLGTTQNPNTYPKLVSRRVQRRIALLHDQTKKHNAILSQLKPITIGKQKRRL